MVVAGEEVCMGRAAEGGGRMVGAGAGEAERGRGVLHASHIVRAGMLTNVHAGQAHSPEPFDDISTESGVGQGATAHARTFRDTSCLLISKCAG